MVVDKDLQFNEQAGELLKKLKEKFTSEVVKQNPDYADEFMLIPHEALRKYIFQQRKEKHSIFLSKGLKKYS